MKLGDPESSMDWKLTESSIALWIFINQQQPE
jgi:hypothetical protein